MMIMTVIEPGSKEKNLAWSPWKKQYHEDKPRGICSMQHW
jgi:hypothetical protein